MKPKLLVITIGACFLSLGLALLAAPFLVGIFVPPRVSIGIHPTGVVAKSFNTLSQIRAYIVESGSMAPAVGVGSLVVTVSQSTYQSPDIVTFAADAKGKNMTTHRVEFKTYPDGPDGYPVYITKGDANEDVDRERITDKNISGRVFLTIPYVGYAAVFMKQPLGFIMLVIVPATIIIYEELKTLARELKKLLGKLKLRIHPRQFQFKEIGQAREFPKVLVVVPVFAAALLVLSVTSSFFADRENSAGNIFSAAALYNETPLQPLSIAVEPSPSPEVSSSPTVEPSPSVTPEATPSVEP